MKSQHKIQRRDDVVEFLKQWNIEHRIVNNGWHIIIAHKGKIADLWPSTGKYRIDGKYKVGVFSLLEELGLGDKIEKDSWSD